MTNSLGPYLLGPNDTAENGIYTGDSRDLAQAMPDESVDIVFTSPPYNVGLDYGTWDDSMPEEEYWQFQAEWIRDAYRVTRPGGRFYLVLNDMMMWRAREIAIEAGWKFHQPIVWCKPNMAGGAPRITKDWNCLTEWCLLFHKGKRTPMRGDVMGVNTFNWIVASTPQTNFTGTKRKVFVAQMALDVAFAWLARSPGDVVYDPFTGSGTTPIAAKMLGRQFIGFEIDPDTAQLARDRLRNTQPPLPLEIPEQVALFEGQS